MKQKELEYRKFDTISKATEVLKEIFKKYPEFEMLEICKNEYNRERTPDELSRCASQMGVLLCRVGEVVAEMTTRANEAYIYRKFKYLWNFNSLSGLTAKERENIAMEQTLENYEIELVNRYIADLIKVKYEDYARFVNLIQTRLGVLKQERINSNF